MEIVDSLDTTLRALGKDENWLALWLLEKPSRLGVPLMSVAEQLQAVLRRHIRSRGVILFMPSIFAHRMQGW